MSRFVYERLFPFVLLAEALAAVLTLGFWYPLWTLKASKWYAYHAIKRGR